LTIQVHVGLGGIRIERSTALDVPASSAGTECAPWPTVTLSAIADSAEANEAMNGRCLASGGRVASGCRLISQDISTA